MTGAVTTRMAQPRCYVQRTHQKRNVWYKPWNAKRVRCSDNTGISRLLDVGPTRAEGWYVHGVRKPRCQVYTVPQGAGGTVSLRLADYY